MRCTAPDLAPYLQREQIQTRRLSRAALETLAIIAYHQPITRAELEEMRGVSVSKGTLDLLLETGWVAPKGRRDTPGRPVTWVTTPGFWTISISPRSTICRASRSCCRSASWPAALPRRGEGSDEAYAGAAEDDDAGWLDRTTGARGRLGLTSPRPHRTC